MTASVPAAPAAGAATGTTLVLLNPHSGTGGGRAARDELRRIFADLGVADRVEVRLLPPARLADAAREAVRAGAAGVVVGGGDGTISGVAAVLAGTDVPLGVLPLGTRNHFARDLGLPGDLAEAARVAVLGEATRIDVGEVNGRVFVNNSSIGVYPRLVRQRERLQQTGMSKYVAMFWAGLVVLRRHGFFGVRLVADGAPLVRRTPFVFIGNNAYVMEGLRASRRPSLADGRLAVYVMNAGGRRSLLWLALQILLGRTQDVRELDTFEVGELTIETRRRGGHVALDGEVVKMAGPLEYRVRPGALLVRVGERPPVDAGP